MTERYLVHFKMADRYFDKQKSNAIINNTNKDAALDFSVAKKIHIRNWKQIIIIIARTFSLPYKKGIFSFWVLMISILSPPAELLIFVLCSYYNRSQKQCYPIALLDPSSCCAAYFLFAWLTSFLLLFFSLLLVILKMYSGPANKEARQKPLKKTINNTNGL